jgi:hypothetical protein
VSQPSESRRETPASNRVAPRVEKFPAVKPKFTKETFGQGEGSPPQDGAANAQGEA